MKLKSSVVLPGLIFLLAVNTLFAQKQFKNTSDSKITVTGTSTMHDWNMESQTFDCSVSVGENLDGQADVGQITFSLQVESLKSESSALDKNAYKALKTKDIQFHSTGLEQLQISSNQVTGIITGELTIAGATKSISLPFEGQLNNENEFETDVTCKINMKDFSIDPPTFMFGVLKTGSEVDVIIHLKLQPY